MSRVRHSGFRLAVAIGIAVVVTAGGGSCAPERRGELTFPSRLGGLPRFLSLSGEDAEELIARFRGRSVEPLESRVALYGIGGKAIILFIARYPNARDSGEQLAALASKVGPDSGLHDHARLDVKGVAVHSWVGHGLRHYAFARETQLAWIAAPEAKAQRALAEVLRVKVDEVPKPYREDEVPKPAP